jgi:predicted esterase
MRRLALLVLCLAGAAGPGAVHAESEEGPEPVVTRVELADAFLAFEHAVRDHPPAGPEAWRDLNARFDGATTLFFAGRFAPVATALRRLAAQQAGHGDDPLLALIAALHVSVDVPFVLQDDERTVRVHLATTSPVRVPEAPAPVLRIELVAPDGTVTAGEDLALPAGGATDVRGVWELRWNGEEPPPLGRWTVRTRTPRGLAGPTAHVSVVRQPPSVTRTAHAARLDALAPEDPALVEALVSVRARNDVLVDAPDPTRSITWLVDPHRHATEVAGEIAVLEAGHDPYRGRAGHLWRVVPYGASPIPVRLYVPPACVEVNAPLLVALHGMGGDENVWAEGYGAGLLVELAEEHGFVLAAPLTYRALLGAGAVLDALVDTIADDVPIDRDRVVVLGHSLGAGVALAMARARPDHLRAVAGLCGGGILPDAVPTLLVYGALDRLAPPSRQAAVVERARAAGAEIEVRVMEHQGHTLGVPEALPGAIRWLLERTAPR